MNEWQTCIEHVMMSSTSTTCCFYNGTNWSTNSVNITSINTTTTHTPTSCSNSSFHDIMNPSNNTLLLVGNGLLQSVFTHTSTCLPYDNNDNNDQYNDDTTTLTSLLSKQKRGMMMDHNNH